MSVQLSVRAEALGPTPDARCPESRGSKTDYGYSTTTWYSVLCTLELIPGFCTVDFIDQD